MLKMIEYINEIHISIANYFFIFHMRYNVIKKRGVKMIDLHTHTIFSDGIQTVEQILKAAEDKNLKVSSITDHDTIDAYIEINKIKSNPFTGKLITGAELYFIQNDVFNELLGYKFDIEKISMSFIFDKEERQKKELNGHKNTTHTHRICDFYTCKFV